MTQPVDIRFACAACGKLLRGKSDWIGRKFKCPHCGNVHIVSDSVQSATQIPNPTPNFPAPPPKPSAPAWPMPAPVAVPRPAFPPQQPFPPFGQQPPPPGGFPPPNPASAFPQPGPFVVNPVNPYAAPAATYAPSPSAYRQAAAPSLRPTDLIGRAWNLLGKNSVAALMLGAIFFVTNALLPMGLGYLGRELGMYRDIRTAQNYQLLVSLSVGILALCIHVGVMKYALRVAQHGRAELDQVVPDAFQAIQCFLASLLQGFVFAMVVIACLIPVVIFGYSLRGTDTIDNLAVGMLVPLVGILFALACVLFFVALWFPTLPLIIHERKDVISALSEAQRMTRGNKLNVYLAIVLLFLSVLPLALVVGGLSYGIDESLPLGIGQVLLKGLLNSASSGVTTLLYAFLCVVTYMGLRRMPVHGIDRVALPRNSGPVFGNAPGFGGPPANAFGDFPQPSQAPQPPPAFGPPPSSRPSKTIGPPPGF